MTRHLGLAMLLLAVSVAAPVAAPVAAQDSGPASDTPPADTTLALVERARALTWSGGAAEAIRILAPLAEARPQDATIQGAYAQALHASERIEAARERYDHALSLAPDDALLLASSGELERWSGDWVTAQRRLRRALDLGLPPSDHARAETLLEGLRVLHGPRAEATARIATDTNGFTRRRIPIAASSHVGGPWRLLARVENVGLSQAGQGGASASVETIRAEAQASYSPTARTTLDVTLGGETDGDAVRPRAAASVSRRWIGTRYAIATLRVASGGFDAAGPEAYRLRVLDAAGEGYVDLTPTLAAYGSVLARSVSDGNLLAQAGATARARLLGTLTDARPDGLTVHASATALVESSREVYAASDPYWTPDRLLTTSAMADADLRVARGVDVGGTLGLSRQAGPLGAATSLVLGARLAWTGERASVGAEWRREGSEFYSVRAVSLRARLRW